MNVLEYMKDHLLILDGAMGTMLQARGLQAGELPERWNLSRPEEITAIHRAYFDAGSNVVCANTFGANRLKFGPDELEALIRAAVENAEKAREQSTGGQEKFIALDLGPCGKLLRPYGDLDFEDAVAVYAETVRIGAASGADLVMIETMNDSYDTKAAVLAVKENCGLPLFVSNAYGADGKLMTGASPEAMAAMLEGLGADVIGMNCSLGPDALAETAGRLLEAAAVPVMMKPNAGLPRVEDGRTVYDVGPEAFAASMKRMAEQGVRAVGGCCGTTPEYIRRLKEACGDAPVFRTAKPRTVVASYTKAVELGKAPVLVGERINPTGKKRFREALQNGDIAYVLGEAVRQQEAGAHMLDVNVGAPGIDERETLVRVTEEVQAVCDLPLQLDTADPAAMEAALRRYNGKAMINSVNGKRESMEAVFPLAKKYGGVVVALTLDENGIPETADGRVEIAERILREALKAGLKKEDLVFDPLTMAVSADPKAAKVTLEALRRIRRELGCPAALGVSNVSFGLPQREMIGSAFFLAALGAGLSAAIMNPCSPAMMTAWRSYAALNELDPQCAEYIGYVTSLPAAAPAGSAASAAPAEGKKEEGSALRRAVTKGLKSEAAAQAQARLEQGADPMALVQEDIIPALNTVGEGFEKKTMFLPQLMMSAEAAEAAFRKIKEAVKDSGQDRGARMTVVLATVKGDIHDIGKNIVRLLLENYGFTVIDLGKDVPPEKIVEAAVGSGAPVIGLSALMTTTVPAMEETIRLAREKAPGVKVMVGGAVLTQAYADRIGADAYSADALGAVRYCERLEAERKG